MGTFVYVVFWLVTLPLRIIIAIIGLIITLISAVFMGGIFAYYWRKQDNR